MDGLIKDLGNLDWSEKTWRKGAADILSCWTSAPEDLAAYVRSWDDELKLERSEGSHNTSTHYKYLIYRDEERRFTLWLHDYKPSDERGPGYAQVPHNHRYDLCSVLLHGGYDTMLYDVSHSVAEIYRETLRPGQILSLDCDQVHALEQICEGTQSLFVEGPVLRNYSTVFYADGNQRKFYDFTGLHPEILARLEGRSS